jgi:rRNA biogenesis protein RRP5
MTCKNSSTDSDSDESDSEDKSLKRRKTRKERNEEVRQREELLRKKEELLMDTGRKPETVDDFEISVLASPNSSLVWLKYMAFHLEQAEITKARAVGEKALKTISFREEQEKLNVWVALLNLENLYGTQSSLEELFERALQFNEPLVIYNHLANIYSQSNKSELAEALYHTMLKKFKQNKTVWIDFGLYYMKNNRLESARKLMQRSLTCLEKRDHIEVISKFAQMEFKFGDPEHGKTLFENILSNFPKRVDLWSVYIDMMCKYVLKNDNKESEDSVRNIFERVITLKLAAKKMKFIFKRYIEFESQYNNEDRIDRIKQKALEYVEGNALN